MLTIPTVGSVLADIRVGWLRSCVVFVPGRPASLPSFRSCVLEAARRGVPPRWPRRRATPSSWAIASPNSASCRRRASTSSSPIRPIICSSRARCRVPTRAWSTRSTTSGTNSPISPLTTRSLGLARPTRRVMKRDATIVVIGSYHNIFRVGAIMQDLGLLDSQRHRLAQGQSDAEFPRPPFHQRARDADLGGARAASAKSTLSTTRP